MKNLWTVLPPLLADNFGFLEVVNASDGCGIIDDSGEFRLGGEHNRRNGHEAHGRNRAGREGRAHGGRHGGGGDRVTVSGASSEDVITGTRGRILDDFEEVKARLDPRFVLLSAGPCGAMIGTDLNEIAETITREAVYPRLP